MAVDWSNINLDTHANFVHDPLYLAKIKSVMLELGKEISSETLPPNPTPEEVSEYTKRQMIAARFFENPDHWVFAVGLRMASLPSIVAVKDLLLTPGANLAPEQRVTVGSTLYSTLNGLMAYFASRL